MNCKNMKPFNGKNIETQREITVEIGKSNLCRNNCRNCPNKQPSSSVTKIDKVEK